MATIQKPGMQVVAIDEAATVKERTRPCSCGHVMIEMEVMYSDLFDCCVAFWMCPSCHDVYEEFLE